MANPAPTRRELDRDLRNRSRAISQWRQDHIHREDSTVPGLQELPDHEKAVQQAYRVQVVKMARMEENKQEAIRLRKSKKKCHAKIIGTKYIESVIPRKDDMRGRLRHSPLFTGTPNVDADASGQLRKEGITRLSEEFGLRNEYIGLLRRAGGRDWDRRRQAALAKTYDETIGLADVLHPEVIAKVIASGGNSVVSPPAPLEWRHLKQYQKLQEKRQVESRAEKERRRPQQRALSVQSQKEEDEMRANMMRAEGVAEEIERRLSSPIKGRLIEEEALMAPYLANTVPARSRRPATTLQVVKGSPIAIGVPYAKNALTEQRRNPGFEIMRRIDMREPVRTPAAHRRAMAKEEWHRADHRSLYSARQLDNNFGE